MQKLYSKVFRNWRKWQVNLKGTNTSKNLQIYRWPSSSKLPENQIKSKEDSAEQRGYHGSYTSLIRSGNQIYSWTCEVVLLYYHNLQRTDVTCIKQMPSSGIPWTNSGSGISSRRAGRRTATLGTMKEFAWFGKQCFWRESKIGRDL